MTLSEELMHDWAMYCAVTCGTLLPINTTYITDEGSVRLGYEVPDGGDAIEMPSGLMVRQVMIEYEVEEIQRSDIC